MLAAGNPKFKSEFNPLLTDQILNQHVYFLIFTFALFQADLFIVRPHPGMLGLSKHLRKQN
jgi:hypothetical protein